MPSSVIRPQYIAIAIAMMDIGKNYLFQNHKSVRICDILAKPCWVTTFDPFLSLSLDKTLCKWSSCWRFVKHWPRLASCNRPSVLKLHRPISQDVPLSIARLLPNGTSAIKLSPLQLKSTFPQISPDDHVTQTWCTPKTVKVFLKVKCKCQIPDRTEAFRSYNCNEKCL